MDLSEYIPTRVDAHHTKLVHRNCGHETYVPHDSTLVHQEGASIKALTDVAATHAKACK